MNEIEKAVAETKDLKAAPQKKRFVFDRTNLSWRLTFPCWDQKLTTVEFQFNYSLKGQSMYLIQTRQNNGITVKVFDVKDNVASTLATAIRLNMPNFWPTRDPHQIFSSQETDYLYQVLIREAMITFLQRVADGWRAHTAHDTGADDFVLEMVDRPKEVLPDADKEKKYDK